MGLLEDAVARLRRRGAAFADARHVRDEREALAVRDGRVERHFSATSQGFGVRVLVDGAWGFGARAGARDDAAALDAAAEAAWTTARAAATLGGARVELADEEPQRGRFATTVARDFFAVPLADKLALVHAVCAALRAGAGARARSASAHVGARRQDKRLATSDGTSVEQLVVHAGGGMKLVVADGDAVAHRSYPMELDGGVAAGGWEVIERFDFLGAAPRIADEALALLAAPPCPAGETTVILDTPQLALQIHESCGHPTESDRAFGDEVSLAGASFLTPDRLGRFRYGSRHVNLTADATTPGALGTFGWDDEGVPAKKTPLVARGQFVGYLTSRETAARLGLPRSGGCLRAEAWNRFPIVRMVNVSLEPDPRGPSLEELVADTDDGILMGNNKSWSIDDLRLNFQFGCELAWEIKKGKRARIVKNPLYGGSTPRFWSACDAVGGPEAFRMWGLLSCGKGDPMQLMAVGHGCPPARFRGINVGSE
ncbi:MAG TPA: TldD/PmbA family protein [Polyangia bacterium]